LPWPDPHPHDDETKVVIPAYRSMSAFGVKRAPRI
jgi:hypothetical protein